MPASPAQGWSCWDQPHCTVQALLLPTGLHGHRRAGKQSHRRPGRTQDTPVVHQQQGASADASDLPLAKGSGRALVSSAGLHDCGHPAAPPCRHSLPPARAARYLRGDAAGKQLHRSARPASGHCMWSPAHRCALHTLQHTPDTHTTTMSSQQRTQRAAGLLAAALLALASLQTAAVHASRLHLHNPAIRRLEGKSVAWRGLGRLESASIHTVPPPPARRQGHGAPDRHSRHPHAPDVSAAGPAGTNRGRVPAAARAPEAPPRTGSLPTATPCPPP